jgi:hypothetical protein
VAPAGQCSVQILWVAEFVRGKLSWGKLALRGCWSPVSPEWVGEPAAYTLHKGPTLHGPAFCLCSFVHLLSLGCAYESTQNPLRRMLTMPSSPLTCPFLQLPTVTNDQGSIRVEWHQNTLAGCPLLMMLLGCCLRLRSSPRCCKPFSHTCCTHLHKQYTSTPKNQKAYIRMRTQTFTVCRRGLFWAAAPIPSNCNVKCPQMALHGPARGPMLGATSQKQCG